MQLGHTNHISSRKRNKIRKCPQQRSLHGRSIHLHPTKRSLHGHSIHWLCVLLPVIALYLDIPPYTLLLVCFRLLNPSSPLKEDQIHQQLQKKTLNSVNLVVYCHFHVNNQTTKAISASIDHVTPSNQPTISINVSEHLAITEYF